MPARARADEMERAGGSCFRNLGSRIGNFVYNFELDFGRATRGAAVTAAAGPGGPRAAPDPAGARSREPGKNQRVHFGDPAPSQGNRARKNPESYFSYFKFFKLF